MNQIWIVQKSSNFRIQKEFYENDNQEVQDECMRIPKYYTAMISKNLLHLTEWPMVMWRISIKSTNFVKNFNKTNFSLQVQTSDPALQDNIQNVSRCDPPGEGFVF